MSKINGYGINQSSLYANASKNKSAKETKEKDKVDKSEKKNSSVQLSTQAKKLLDELKKKYSNMDFIVADYENDEEASAYLSRGTKEFSVLIDPETLEEMASDEDAKAKNIGILEDSVSQLKDMSDKLGDKKDEVAHLGVSIGKDGKVSYFAELEKIGERQKEWLEKSRENRKEEKASKEKTALEKKMQENAPYEKTKKTRVQADSVEELIEKINAVDWDKVKAEEKPEEGGRFDFSV